MFVLASFLNVGERIASSDENWMLFGTDEAETAVVRNFLWKLVEYLEELESKVYEVVMNGGDGKWNSM